jgi:hypothetical protein
MKDNIQMILTICLFAYIIFLQQCKQSNESNAVITHRVDTIITIDTTPPPPVIFNLPIQETPPPIIVYVDSFGRKVETAQIDTTNHLKAHLYQDSTEDENLTIYYSSTIEGRLIQNALDYKLKVPKLITKRIEIPKPYPVPVSVLLFNGGIGGNISKFSSITAGVQFVSSKGWAVAYDYDLLENSHNVKLGIKLFQFKNKK